MSTSNSWSSPSTVTTPSGVIFSMPVVVSSTFGRCNASAQTPLSTMIRLEAGGYCGMTFAARSGRPAYCASMASASCVRKASLSSLTERPWSGQSGSTSAIGRSVSADRQNSQNRYHSR